MFNNRELSWLEFNHRVLLEAKDETLPILERMKFSAIFSSNLDEFYMVRVASIKDLMNQEYDKEDPSGRLPEEQFTDINEKVSELVKEQYEITNNMFDILKDKGHALVKYDEFTEDELADLETLFDKEIYPVLTPMAVDISRPFPLLVNKGLYIATIVSVKDIERLAIVPVPSVLNRVITISKKKKRYCLLEDVIRLFLHKLFEGNIVENSTIFRITKNAELNIMEESANDLLILIEKSIKQRKWGDVIRLEIQDDADEHIMHLLKSALELDPIQIFKLNGILDLTVLFGLIGTIGDKRLNLHKHQPKVLPFMNRKSVFKTIKEDDVFLHHPYDSFDFVVDFIEQAAQDDSVLAIKQTLYRVSGDSPIVKALAEAAERGKQVTVLVELMARFDEENNINWAKKLEKTGCHVIYGIYGLKTHSKITLVVRKEKNKIRRYVHLGTGNYNDSTAKLYTDMGILTAKESFGADASAFFNTISGYSDSMNLNKLHIAPYDMRETFYHLIEREIKNARNGDKAHVIAKINSLVDKEMVEKLYEASQAGVRIELIVRGICTLSAGVPGLSENITVTSIVGRFLEHSRIYYFYNRGDENIYLSSADWMTRNLNRRIEILFPIDHKIIKKRIRNILKLYLMDNRKAWVLNQDGGYSKKVTLDKVICSHEILASLSYKNDEEFISALKKALE